MKQIVFLYASLLMLLSTAQCRKENTPVQTSNTTIIQPTNTDTFKTFLALGDSYTIGQSVTIADRFPAQTTMVLRSLGIRMKDPVYIATTGWTTDNLSAAINSQQPQGPFNVVSLLIGVNDQYQRRDTTGYRLRFRNLLQKSIELAGNKRNHVFVLSIPDYSVTPFAAGSDTASISRQIKQFNDINKEETVMGTCNYLDITPSTREALFDPSLLANDGLHPSGKEYGKWANWLAPMMGNVLR